MKICNLFRVGLVLLGLLISTRAWSAVPVLTATNYVEGEALVRFQASETLAGAQQIVAGYGLTMPLHYDWLSQHEGQVIALLRSTNLSTPALLAELRAEPSIALAEPNYTRSFSDLRPPNDPNFHLLWGLRNQGQGIEGFSGTSNSDIGFLKAWGLARPSTNEVVVGILDTGIDPTHPDLMSNLWTNPGEIAGNGVDDDHNGYVDDVHGYDFALGTGTLTDSGFHGTHVSGTVAASGNNHIGVIGVDYQAHLMGLKVSSDGASIDSSAVVEAIQYATMMKTRGVNVVALNASFGGPGFSSTESSVIQAAGTAGIIFCAAAGNDTNNNDINPEYPASYRLNNEIVVAASDSTDALAYFSNFGASTVDLAAPGVGVFSCAPVSQPGYSTYAQTASGVFSGAAVEFSPTTVSAGVSGTIYNCGLGNSGDFPAAVRNNIALIQRGTITFAAKAANAKNAGARAVIIYNNVNSALNFTLGTSSNWVPTIAIAQSDGLALKATLPAAGTVYNFSDPSMIYQFLDGTSMATPHVSGAVAFAAMNFPDDTVAQRIQRILANVTPVPGLVGVTATGGRLNLAGIVDSDNNGLPDWWELQYFGQLTGTDPNADPDGDGESNLAEFLCGTDPTDPDSVLRLTGLPANAPTGITLQWPSVAGRYYRVLSGTNLLTGFDTVVQTNLAATPPLNLFTNPPAGTAPAKFYRLQLEP